MDAIYRKLAAIHRCSAAKIRAEMEKAVMAGAKSADPNVRKRWEEIPSYGKIPSVEETVLFCAREALRRVGTK